MYPLLFVFSFLLAGPAAGVAQAPARPALPEDVAAQVAGLQEQIAELRNKFLRAEIESLDEAISLAEQVLVIRVEHQGPQSGLGGRWTDAQGNPAEWYEVADARRAVADLRGAAGLGAEDRADLASLIGSDEQQDQLKQAARYAEAQAIVARQLDIRRRVLGDEHPDTLLSINNMGSLLTVLDKLSQAEPYLREALEARRRVLGDEHPATYITINGMGYLLRVQGKQAEAEVYYREALEGLRRVRGNDDPDTLASINSMGVLLTRQGKLAEAERYYREGLEGFRRLLGQENPSTLTLMSNLGLLLQRQGKLAEAEPYIREALEVRRRVLGDDNPETLISINIMGTLLISQGKLAEAEPYRIESVEGCRRVLGDEHSQTITAINNMGSLLAIQGRLTEAERYYREALDGCRRLRGDGHRDTLDSIRNMGLLLKAQGKLAEAEPYWREALEVRRIVLGDENPDTLRSLADMGYLLEAEGKLAEAEPYWQEALEGRRRLLGNDHEDTLVSISDMGDLLKRQGKLAEAESYHREALEGRRRALGNEHRDTLSSINSMGDLLKAQGKLAEAEPYYREALEGFNSVVGQEHASTLTLMCNMGNLLEAEGKLAEAEPYLREALEARRRVLGDEHPDTLVSLTSLGYLLIDQGKLAEAELYLLEALDLAERRRTQIVGEESARAAYAGRLELPGIAASLSGLFIETARPSEALGAAERGRGRAMLDLLARGDRDLVAEVRASGDVARVARLEEALERESSGRAALLEAEAGVAASVKERRTAEDAGWFSEEERPGKLAGYDRQIAERRAAALRARQALGEATAAVIAELSEFLPAADALRPQEILAGLSPREALVCYTWTAERVTVLAAGGGEVAGAVVARSRQDVERLAEVAARVRVSIAERPDDATLRPDTKSMQELLAALLPEGVRQVLDSADRLVVLPDGPLHGIPLEALADGTSSPLSGKAICYASSATLYLDRLSAARRGAGGARPTQVTAILLGDAVYDREAPRAPQFPRSGVLVASVEDGTNAAIGGLRRGDVIQRYAGRDIAGRDALLAAVGEVNREVASGERPADERFAVSLWRDGQEVDASLAPGRIGVVLDQRPPAEGLRAMARWERGLENTDCEASALEQVRLFGGSLASLPGTAQEVKAIGRLMQQVGAEAQVLLNEQATVGNLETLAPGRVYLHLATHGLAGNAQRPYEASLALTRPVEVSPDDIGFLRLEDLVRSWRGKLSGCDLVVLSACDTQRGVALGDSLMALPWGFFYAGAPTVIASLWKVDDTATALLMVRLYENLLGLQETTRQVDDTSYPAGQRMSKLAALREAKAWLAGLSREQADAVRQKLDTGDPQSVLASSRGTFQPAPGPRASGGRPYEHPYYWAAFVLLGSPQ